MRHTTQMSCMALLLFSASPAWAADFKIMEPASLWIVLALIYVLAIYGVITTITSLRKSGNWSLANALAESQPLEQKEANGAVKPVEKRDAAGNSLGYEYPASASRLIGFLGMIVIMALFIGFGSMMIWEWGTKGTVTENKAVTDYLLIGACLFAPYAVNQISGALKALGK